MKNTKILFLSFQSKDLYILFLSINENEKRVTKLLIKNNKNHSNNLIVLIGTLLNEVNEKINNLTSIFIIISPGSFMSMRLAKIFVFSLMLVNKAIKIYLTSSFLFAYFFVIRKIHKISENYGLTILVSKTRTQYYCLKLNNNKNYNEKIHWSIFVEPYKHKKVFNANSLVKNFNFNNRFKESFYQENNTLLIIDFVINYHNYSNQSIIKDILEGKEIKSNSFNQLYHRKSFFFLLKRWLDYPNLNKFMELK